MQEIRGDILKHIVDNNQTNANIVVIHLPVPVDDIFRTPPKRNPGILNVWI